MDVPEDLDSQVHRQGLLPNQERTTTLRMMKANEESIDLKAGKVILLES